MEQHGYVFTDSLALADVDRDGDADIIAVEGGGQNRLYLNIGGGRFTDATGTRMPANTDIDTSLALGDVDGDGDVDLVFGNAKRNRLFLNDSTGRFLGRDFSAYAGGRGPDHGGGAW